MAGGAEWFVGREGELRRVAECAAAVREGRPWVVLIEGESGIGKTALVRGVAALDDFTVLRASCDPAETDLPYGVIAQLTARCAPDLSRCVSLPLGLMPTG
jgi:predicted ATPase